MTSAPTETPIPPTTMDLLVLARGLAGAIAGGLLGYFLFRWLYSNGLYGLMIPGALLGLGAGLAARGKSIPLAIICAVAGLAVGIYSEWSIGRFKQDPSLWFFVTHVHHLRPVKLLMLALGSAAAFWFGQGR